jgi:hypothetical protein
VFGTRFVRERPQVRIDGQGDQMLHTARTRIVALFLPFVLVCAFIASEAPAGAANPTLHVVWNLDASTHLAKLNQDVVVPRGTLTADIDLVTGNFTGAIQLPPAKSTIKLVGLPLASATFKMTQTKPVTGHVDLATFHVTATATFNIQIPSAYALGIVPVNLVGNSCTTAQPVTVTMNGNASLTAASTFTGTYTIPLFKTCALATTALDVTVSGPGNTFTATASPPVA